MTKYKTVDDLDRIHKLLEKYSLTEWPGSQDTFLLLGYKKLSLGAKESYQVLRNLAISNFKADKNNGYTCKVSHDFLAIALGTTRRTQIRRTQELEEHGLVRIIKRANSANMYCVEPRPYPDDTFEETLQQLILRRECLNLLYKAKSFDDLKTSPDQWEQLSEMFKTPMCHDIILEKIPEFTPYSYIN